MRDQRVQTMPALPLVFTTACGHAAMLPHPSPKGPAPAPAGWVPRQHCQMSRPDLAQALPPQLAMSLTDVQARMAAYAPPGHKQPSFDASSAGTNPHAPPQQQQLQQQALDVENRCAQLQPMSKAQTWKAHGGLGSTALALKLVSALDQNKSQA